MTDHVGKSFLSFHWYPKGAAPPRGFPSLARMGDGGGNPLCYLLPLPLCHGSDHGVEEAASWGSRIYGSLERYEVGSVLAENVREFKQFSPYR